MAWKFVGAVVTLCMGEREPSYYVTEQEETPCDHTHNILPHGSASALPEVLVSSRAAVVCRRAGSASGLKSPI